MEDGNLVPLRVALSFSDAFRWTGSSLARAKDTGNLAYVKGIFTSNSSHTAKSRPEYAKTKTKK